MKKAIFICLLVSTTLFSCSNETKETSDKKSDSVSVTGNKPEELPKENIPFDIQSIPISEVEIGQFPYLSYPEGYNFNYKKEISANDIKELDKEYFAISGKLHPIEGKSFKVRIERENTNPRKFNSLLVEKYYVEKIKSLGGVQVNNMAVDEAEIKKIGDQELIDKKFGFSIDYNLLNDIKTFVIRRKDKEIWIQMTLMNEEVGKLTVLEKETK